MTKTISKQRPRAVVVQRSLPPYRIPLFEILRARLEDDGIRLDLVHGSAEEVKAGTIPWAHTVNNRVLSINGRDLTWQPCLRFLRGADLVIVEQATRLLVNYLLLGKQLAGMTNVALWGHGRNFQESSSSRIGEAIKRTLSRRVHWWFAYTDQSAAVVRNLGFPSDRITVVQNSIDTEPLINEKLRLRGDAAALRHLRSALNLHSPNVGVYVGSLYKEKRLDFLLEAGSEIRRQVPDFELLIIGAGPEGPFIAAASQENQWIRWVGPKFDADKAACMSLAKVMLLPALAGLAVIDSFALEVPLVTVDSAGHGPEIDYVRGGVNGVWLPARTGPHEYAEVVASILQDDSVIERLRRGCREAAAKYTLEEMIERYAQGIRRAIAAT
jgi:glycosyltransferase involved in cell wall biosynthesis